MSYILDALRKADAERERGRVPDLHTQPVLRGTPRVESRASGAPWIAVATGVAVLAVAALAWVLLTREAPREPAVAMAPVVAPAPLPAAVVPAPAALPAPATTIAAATAPTPTPTPTPAPQAVVAAPMARSPAARTSVAAPVAAPVSAEPLRPELRKPAPVTPPVAKAEPPAARASEPRVYTQAELPDDIRRELPALTVGGAMYSENASSRMLVINGQVFHERDKLSPTLTLVQIKLKSAVLEYRGYRYTISY
jgi:general secretion pathway protein B